MIPTIPGAAAGPAPVPTLLGDDQQRHQADHEGDGAGVVDPVVAPVVRQVQGADDE